MYCNPCGKPMGPHYKGVCGTCLYREYIRNASFEEISGNARKSRQVQGRKKETKNFISDKETDCNNRFVLKILNNKTEICFKNIELN